jgi:hypothetical protein
MALQQNISAGISAAGSATDPPKLLSSQEGGISDRAKCDAAAAEGAARNPTSCHLRRAGLVARFIQIEG